jgi:hypothetical protein
LFIDRQYDLNPSKIDDIPGGVNYQLSCYLRVQKMHDPGQENEYVFLIDMADKSQKLNSSVAQENIIQCLSLENTESVRHQEPGTAHFSAALGYLFQDNRMSPRTSKREKCIPLEPKSHKNKRGGYPWFVG